jgi:aminopeptidase N
VTPATYRDLWLNEGFATYAQQLYAADRGYQSLASWRAAALRSDGSLRRRYGPPGAPLANQFAQSNVYQCGALLLQAIADRVGQRELVALLRDWVAAHRDGTVDRAAFVAFANRYTGTDLTRLINSWLYSATTPR